MHSASYIFSYTCMSHCWVECQVVLSSFQVKIEAKTLVVVYYDRLFSRKTHSP